MCNEGAFYLIAGLNSLGAGGRETANNSALPPTKWSAPMPLYTFYPCHPDGVSETFLTCELQTDGAAHHYATGVLDLHASASCVSIWCGERNIATHHRAPSPEPAHG